MFRSATFRLTMWYLMIVMIISLLFSVALYSVTTDELSRGLHHETERIYDQFPVFEGNSLLKPTDDYNSGAHRILLRLIGFNVVVLAGAGVASYWLARRTLRPIEAAHEQQKHFTADVSHELRTPLTALKMESEVALMNDKNGKRELRATLASNLEEVAKLERLINNLLRLTRLEAGELEQQFTALDNQSLVATALAHIEKIAGDRGISLKQDVKPAPLSGDRDSLVQLLVILLDNALKYSSAKGTIKVVSYATDNAVVFEISDNGIGIERQALEHVFDRFYRGSSSRNKADRDGFGLGLSIAKMITDIHHGSITLSSRVKHGTTATISLPKAES